MHALKLAEDNQYCYQQYTIRKQALATILYLSVIIIDNYRCKRKLSTVLLVFILNSVVYNKMPIFN